ncbi:MAG: flagellar assembly protein FliH [Chromatiales bacterium]|nr:flagellar assembly protein FliH [Chromatiales bacterium]
MSRHSVEDGLEQWTRWEIPDLDAEPEVEEPEALEPTPTAPTIEEIERIQKQAYDEAYEQGRNQGFEFGHREGLEQGRRELDEEKAALRKQIEQFRSLIKHLSEPFADLDDQVEEELVALSIALVRQLVRRELRTDPGQVVAIVRESLRVLPVAARKICIHLHPEDVDLVREAFALDEQDTSIGFQDDPTLSRGGCRITSENSQVDATLESRLNALIAANFGGERVEDQE